MRTRSTTTPSSRRAGAATAELAVLLPFIAFLCVITADWARIYNMTLTANACARNGALYASDDVYAAQSPYASYTEAALAEAPQLSETPTVSKTTTTDSAGNSAVVVTVTITFDTITSFPGVPKSTTVSRSCQMRIAPLATD
jgi:Flp pilus assembly protein TadG